MGRRNGAGSKSDPGSRTRAVRLLRRGGGASTGLRGAKPRPTPLETLGRQLHHRAAVALVPKDGAVLLLVRPRGTAGINPGAVAGGRA